MLPPVRVTPAVREEIQNALREGETLSEFVETAALRRGAPAQGAGRVPARGRASLAKALETDEFYPLDRVIDEMQARLRTRFEERMAAQKVGRP